MSETTTPQTTAVRVYFLLNGKLQPVSRQVPQDGTLADAAQAALADGPTEAEAAAGLVSGKPGAREALAQQVYTLTQFPGARTVEIAGTRYSRADFEDETPQILVESPLRSQTVRSPLRARGTANTFEATFQYDLVGPDGTLLKSHFVTATSGSGTRGTFMFAVPYTVDRAGTGKLVVYERSAEDGSRIHEVEIPVRLVP